MSAKFTATVILSIATAAVAVPISETCYAGTVTPIEKTGTIVTYDLNGQTSGDGTRGACIKLSNFSEWLCNYNRGGNTLYHEINDFTRDAYLSSKTCLVGFDSNFSDTAVKIHPIYYVECF